MAENGQIFTLLQDHIRHDCVAGAILVEAEETVEHRTKSIVNDPAVHLTTFFSASNTDVVSANTNITVCVFINH